MGEGIGGHVMAARSLLTRGPYGAEPPEAHLKTVPVGKRTALEAQEKVVPRRTGIRRTRRSAPRSLAGQKEEGAHALLSRRRLGGSDPCGLGGG